MKFILFVKKIMLDKAGESSYNNRAKQSRYGITHLTPAQSVTGGSDGFPRS